MQHRYGRHGPHAWKRLQEWKYVRRRPVFPVPVVPTTMMVRIVVPPTTERIIVILMHDHSPPNEQQPDQDIQIITGQGDFPLSYTIPPTHQLGGGTEDDPLIDDANREALIDAASIKELAESKFIHIDRQLLEHKSRKLFIDYIRSHRKSSSADLQGHQAQEKRYVDTYQTSLRKALSSDPGVAREYIDLFCSEKEIRLRDLAKHDRERFSPGRELYDQHELAVIRVVLDLDISQDQVFEEAEIIHTCIVIYKKYFTNLREEVTWPDPGSF